MMIIRHKVRDYGVWRPIFNEHAERTPSASPGIRKAPANAGAEVWNCQPEANTVKFRPS